MSHTDHPDIATHGLANGCPRCAEMAQHPFVHLDRGNLDKLIYRTIENRFGDGSTHAARSDIEALAMARVMTTLEHTGKLFETSPLTVAAYLRDRWKVTIEV